MAQKLFELEADIVLNSDAFATDLSNAVDDAKTLATEIDDLNKAPEGVTSTSLSNIVGDAAAIKTDIGDAKKSADDTDKKIDELGQKGSTVLQGLMETFAAVAASLVETVIAGIFELGAEGIEMAAAEDSPLAKAYNSATETLSITREIGKMEVGRALLPLATSVQQFLDSILSFVLNIDDADKLLAYVDRLESYEAENLKVVAENVRNVFAAFAEVQTAEPISIESMMAGVESQTEYWQQYVDVMDSLTQKGVSADFLAQYADGSVESLAQLQALDAAAPETLQSFMDSMAELEAAEAAAAETINAAQVEVGLASDSTIQTVVDMISELDQSELAKLNMGSTMDAVVESLGARIPALRNHVATIQALVQEVATAAPPSVPGALPTTSFANQWANAMNASWNNPFIPKASGLSYVPYDGYKTELHRGEKILTRQQAQEADRSVGKPAAALEPGMIRREMVSALSEWLAPVSTNQVIGIVNNGLANETRGIR